MSSNQTGSSGSGLDPNVSGLLCYICGWLSGLIFLLIEKDNKTVKYHAWQSIFLSVASLVYFIATFILAFIPFVGIVIGLLNILVSLGLFVVYVICAVKAFQGSRLHLPFIGDLAEKQANG